MTPAQSIALLIAETERWLADHKRAGRGIEAAACAIRIKALKDAAQVVARTVKP